MNEETFKGFDLLKELSQKHEWFNKIINENIQNGKIRPFNEEEWGKIKQQNYSSPSPLMKEFMDMFTLGLNIGNCKNAALQFSYSYDNVDIVCGTVPILKGTLNAEKEGGHWWLETYDKIIDTSFLLVIDKNLKSELGYQENQRITSSQLRKHKFYQARKQYTLDQNLKPKQKKV